MTQRQTETERQRYRERQADRDRNRETDRDRDFNSFLVEKWYLLPVKTITSRCQSLARRVARLKCRGTDTATADGPTDQKSFSSLTG